MRRLIVLVLAFGLLAPSLADAAPSYGAGGRPRSRVVTYLRDGLVVSRLQSDIGSIGRHVVGTARVTVRNTTDRAVTRTLQAGRCTRGPVSAPLCTPAMRFSFSIPAHGERKIAHGFRVRTPPPRQDSVEVTLAKPGTPTDSHILRDFNAELLLKGSAWRENSPVIYGVDGLDTDAATRLNFDIPATSPTRTYMDVHWLGTAAPSGATTTLGHCSSDDCTDQQLHPARGRSGPQLFGTRTDVDIDGAKALRLSTAMPDGSPLFTATLPWAG